MEQVAVLGAAGVQQVAVPPGASEQQVREAVELAEVRLPGLNARQTLFVKHYAACGNASKAAREAGYSEATAGQMGYELLKKPEVSRAVASELLHRARAAEVTTERVIAEVARLAFFDARQLFNDAGEPIHVSQLPEDAARAIVGLDVVTKGNADSGFAEVLKVKLADKGANLALLMRYLGLLKDNLNLAGKVEVDATEQLRQYLSAGQARLPVREDD